jgi:CRISPR-associated protein Csd1
MPAVVQAALNVSKGGDAPQAMCLVTGEQAPVERLHASIKGVWGAQTSGANIVSFNARAFESYGKTERQGENAPVSRAAAFAYTTALNHLLRKDSPQRMQVGDASTVFWAERRPV